MKTCFMKAGISDAILHLALNFSFTFYFLLTMVLDEFICVEL